MGVNVRDLSRVNIRHDICVVCDRIRSYAGKSMEGHEDGDGHDDRYRY
jgi:hypothetical protein